MVVENSAQSPNNIDSYLASCLTIDSTCIGNEYFQILFICSSSLIHYKLTFNMRKGAEDTARTIAGLLDIVAFGGLVDFRMELLFGACMTILAIVAGLTITRLAPLLAVLYIRTWSRSVRRIV